MAKVHTLFINVCLDRDRRPSLLVRNSLHKGTMKGLLTTICNKALLSQAWSIPSSSACKASSTAFATFECSAKDAYCSNPAIMASIGLSLALPKRMISGMIKAAACLSEMLMANIGHTKAKQSYLSHCRRRSHLDYKSGIIIKYRLKWYKYLEMVDLHENE
jgi:hypothetical protein